MSGSRIPYGSRMIRIEDGKMGVLQEHQGELRIFYEDRGEQLIAPKREKWEVFDPAPSRMREEEKLRVALVADRYLRSLVRHEPHRYWEPIDEGAEPFDAGLVKAIVEYLGSRG